MIDATRRTALKIAGSTVAYSLAAGLGTAAKAAEPSGKRRIKIGQIGVTHAHATKLEVYRESPEYEVVGIVERDPVQRQRAAERAPFRDLPWMTTEQLLNVPGLDAVLVETEVRDLLDTAELCISAGKHVHLDKPAGENLEHYRRILAMAERQNLLVQMGYMYRYNPGVVLLRQFLENGWLGDVFEVHSVMSKVVEPHARQKLAEYPGGILFELGCHIIDLVIGVLGAPERVTPFAKRTGFATDELLDNMLAVFEYPRATATVKSSALEVEGFGRRHLTVCGTKGTFHIQPLDSPSVRVALAEPHDEYRQGYQTVEMPPYTRYVADAADMAAIIHGEKPADFSYSHDLAVQTTLLQACALSS